MAFSKAGSLHVTVVSATLLLSPCGTLESDSADTYATVIWGRQRFSTKVAKDHGALPAWNEKHTFDLGNESEVGIEEVIIEIYAVKPEIPELLAFTRLPFSQVLEAREETSLLPLHRPSERNCGQLKVTFKWESLFNNTPTPVSMHGSPEETGASAPAYPPPLTQASTPEYPPMSSFPPPQGAPADAAANALAGLAIGKENQYEHDSKGVDLSSGYPPYSTHASGPYPSQGLPYLASPIGGLVTESPYSPPTSAYTHPPPFETQKGKSDTYNSSSAQPYGQPPVPYPYGYPPSAPPALNLPEDLDVSSTGNEKKESSYPPYYSGPPASHTEGYPPTPSSYPPNFNESNTGRQGYPSYPEYGVPPSSGSYPPAPSTYPSQDTFSQGKEKTKKDSNFPTSQHETAPFPAYPAGADGGYPPSSQYPPLSGQHDPVAVSGGYPSQQGVEPNATPLGYPPQKTEEGKSEKGKNKGDSKAPSPTPGSAERGADDKGFFHGHEYGHGVHGQPYGQPAYGYAQPGYPPVTPGYSPYGYAPSYPPAYPGHGYPAEAYPSQHGHGVPGFGYGHSGHEQHHAPAIYGGGYGHATGYGVPQYGHGGHYKSHKGGHKYKGHKHKKLKGHKGHYLHYGQAHGHHGGHYKHKHKH